MDDLRRELRRLRRLIRRLGQERIYLDLINEQDSRRFRSLSRKIARLRLQLDEVTNTMAEVGAGSSSDEDEIQFYDAFPTSFSMPSGTSAAVAAAAAAA